MSVPSTIVTYNSVILFLQQQPKQVAASLKKIEKYSSTHYPQFLLSQLKTAHTDDNGKTMKSIKTIYCTELRH